MITDLQLVLNQRDLDALSAQLKVALDNHLAWLSDLNYAMICEHELLPSFCACAEPYRQCKFGQWFYSIEEPAICDHHDFIELGVRHKELHLSVCRIVDSFKLNGKPSKSIYKVYKTAEDVFLDTLKNLVHKSLEANVNTDFLTRLPNRQALDVILKHVHGRIKRGKGKFFGSIALLDIDHFKHFNDNYGHAIGDLVLSETSNLLVNSIRDCDFVARYGGEEFIIFFPGENPENAGAIADKLRMKIADSQIDIGNNNAISINCSFGVSPLDGNQPIKNSILNADEALYEAKELGRNQVVVKEVLP